MQNYVSNMRKKLSYVIVVLFVCILQMTASAVTVKADNTVKPTKLSLTMSEMVCRPEDNLLLYADEDDTMPANANRNMNWETSDATIVEVDNSYDGMESCRITAKKVGTAVITGTSVIDEKIKVQCTINVVEGQYSSDGEWVLDKDGNLTCLDGLDPSGILADEHSSKVKKAKVIITGKYGISLDGYTNLKQVEFVVRNSAKETTIHVCGCNSLKTIDLRELGTLKVKSVSFGNCSSLKTIDLSGLDTSELESIYISDCSSLKTVDLSGLDTSEVTGIYISDCSSLKTVDLSGLNLSKVKDLSGLVENCTNLQSLNMSNLYAPNVKKVENMFQGCTKLKKLNMSGVNFSKLTDIKPMFAGDDIALETVDMSNMDLSNVKSLSGMFPKCSKLKKISMQNLQIPKVTDMQRMFCDDASMRVLPYLKTVDMRGVNAPKLKIMRFMFVGCTSLKNVYFDNMNAPNIEDTFFMFHTCKSLETIDVSSLGFKNATLFGMFINCSSLKTVNLNTIHKSTFTSIGNIFAGCASLKNVYINNLEVSKVTDISGMFNGCSSLETVDLSGWKMSKVKYMDGMFWNCTNLKKVDLGNFDTSNVSSMQSMFYGCSKLQEVNMENFILSSKLAENVTGGYIQGVGDVFTGCNSLKYIKTPKNVQVDVRLPHEMYSSSGMGFSMLPRGGSVTLSVNGYKPTVTKVTKLSMNKSSVKMKIGEKIILSAAASPMSNSKNVKWKSSNKKIATVDSKGNVKAKKAGSVTITATSKSNKKLKAKCKITVYGKIKSVKLSATKKNLVVGEKISLKTTVSPKTAEKNFWYRSSNPAVAQVDANGKVVANKEGVTTITVTSMENKKVTAKYVITVKSKVNSAVSKGVNITPTLIPNTPEIPMSIDSIISPEVPSDIGAF